MLLRRFIVATLFIMAFTGGGALLAQSLTNDLNSSSAHNASDLSSAVSGSAVSASVNASIGSTVDASGGAGGGSRVHGSAGRSSAHRTAQYGQEGNRNTERRSAMGVSAVPAYRNSEGFSDRSAGNAISGISSTSAMGGFGSGRRTSSWASGHSTARDQLKEASSLQLTTKPPKFSPQESLAEYSEDFPDSTQGTALVSPPDTGTQSPLDWSPGLDFSFGDFEQSIFLAPSLHVSGKRGAARWRHRKTQSARGDHFTMPTSRVSGLPGSSLQSDPLAGGLSQPD
jgi:hypothetical protein